LRNAFHERVQTMLDFVAEQEECRSRFLLRYFGQSDSADCGRCDICRERNRKPKDLAASLKAFIRPPYTLDDVRAAFGTGDQAWKEVLRDLIDRGEVPPYEY
jgi:superfamily II DNA helicase RecQ